MENTSALLAVFLLGFVCADNARAARQTAASDLAGTSWQLVKFEGSDDRTLTPEDTMKYTIAFETDGTVSVRIDCNRGHGTWKSGGPNQLEFGPLALTRAMCPPAPLNDRLAKDWQYVRSYLLKDGHLFVSLMADAGTYEFEPIRQQRQAGGRVEGTAIYRERMALPASAVFEAFLEDVSRADAAAEVIARTRVEHPGYPPIRFVITYEPARIAQNHDYSVRARITDGNRMVFTTVQHYPVLTRGNGNKVSLLLSRSSVPPAASRAPSESPLSILPATFVGVLPCADCPGIRYQVNLFPDHTFVSRMTYEERNLSLGHHGHWQLTSKGKMLVLQGEHQAQEKFAVRDPHTLRKLDLEGHEIESKLNYDFKRTPEFEPIEPQSVTTATRLLENTYWKLTSLHEVPVTAVSQQEPHFVLNSETHRVSGSGGCNRLTGSYELKDDHLTFSQMATTNMACMEGMDAEEAFIIKTSVPESLQVPRRYEINLNVPVLLFAAAISIVSAVMFGLAPAVQCIQISRRQLSVPTALTPCILRNLKDSSPRPWPPLVVIPRRVGCFSQQILNRLAHCARKSFCRRNRVGPSAGVAGSLCCAAGGAR